MASYHFTGRDGARKNKLKGTKLKKLFWRAKISVILLLKL